MIAQSAFEIRSHDVETKSRTIAISYFVCLPLETMGFSNAFSTRTGGVSSLPKNSLNLDFKGDSVDHVTENRRRFFKAFGHLDSPLITGHQTHSDDRAFVESTKDTDLHADALFTNKKDIFLAVKTADCLPVLVADPKTGVLAVVHAGWRGSLKRIAQKTIEELKIKFGVDPHNCISALGPSACGQCYEVSTDVVESFAHEFSYGDTLFEKSPVPKKAFFNLEYANVRQLMESGLNSSNIHVLGACTIHQNDLFFSHRKESTKKADSSPSPVGRMLGILGRF